MERQSSSMQASNDLALRAADAKSKDSQPQSFISRSSNPIEMDGLPSASVGVPLKEHSLESSTVHLTEADGVDSPSSVCDAHHGVDLASQVLPYSTSPSQEPESSPPDNLHMIEDSSSPLARENTAPAIGPATDKPTPITKEMSSEGPVLYITLLLASSGARHPYRLDGKYMRKREVVVESNNPINMSLYKLKELILRDWRDEWDLKPSSPEAIRLICMGKMLNDKSRLCDSGFANGLTPHIVHMTVKPQEIIDEEEANKQVSKSLDGAERSPRCRCIIQ